MLHPGPLRTMSDGIPRLSLAELDPALAEYLKPTVDRLGYLGEFFQTTGHVPVAARQFMEYTKAVKAPLADNLNEVLALAVCAALGARYELIQHERLAQRLGFTLEWIAAAEGPAEAASSVLDEEERVAQELALTVLQDFGRGAAGSVERAHAVLGTQRVMAALLQITRFMTIASLCNALDLELPLKSVFEESRSA